MTKKQNPTLKQKRLVKELLTNPTATAKSALIKSGYSESTASNGLDPVVKSSSFIAILDKIGVTDIVLATKAKAGLNAKQPLTYKGRVTEEYPDHNVRYKYWSKLLEAKGHITGDNSRLAVIGKDYDVFIEN